MSTTLLEQVPTYFVMGCAALALYYVIQPQKLLMRYIDVLVSLGIQVLLFMYFALSMYIGAQPSIQPEINIALVVGGIGILLIVLHTQIFTLRWRRKK